MPTRLFALPEYHQGATLFMISAVRALMHCKDPVLRQIRNRAVEHVPTSQVTMPSGEVVKSAPIVNRMEFAIHMADAIQGKPESLAASLDEASEAGLRNTMPKLFEYVERVCEASGNTINANGQPLSYDLIIQMLDTMNMSFDEDGNSNAMLIVHPTMAEKIGNLPPPTEEQSEAWAKMIERKRREYNESRRVRRLS